MPKHLFVLLVLGGLVPVGLGSCVPIGDAKPDKQPAAAAGRTFGLVNPRPRVVVEGETGKVAVDLGKVPDEQVPGVGLTITDFRQSLMAGFRNMVGASFTEQPKDAKLLLSIELAELSRANIGSIGGYIIIRYKGTWYRGNGNKVASLAGVAEPRNPTEPGPRHLEDVVEVMYEEMVQGLEKAQGVKTR